MVQRHIKISNDVKKLTRPAGWKKLNESKNYAILFNKEMRENCVKCDICTYVVYITVRNTRSMPHFIIIDHRIIISSRIDVIIYTLCLLLKCLQYSEYICNLHTTKRWRYLFVSRIVNVWLFVVCHFCCSVNTNTWNENENCLYNIGKECTSKVMQKSCTLEMHNYMCCLYTPGMFRPLVYYLYSVNFLLDLRIIY